MLAADGNKNVKRTKKDCQSIIFNLAVKNGLPPSLISEKLLSKEDKEDMLAGLLTEQELEAHVKAWIENGTLDYCLRQSIENDSNLEVLDGISKLRYNKPFILRQELDNEKEDNKARNPNGEPGAKGAG